MESKEFSQRKRDEALQSGGEGAFEYMKRRREERLEEKRKSTPYGREVEKIKKEDREKAMPTRQFYRRLDAAKDLKTRKDVRYERKAKNRHDRGPHGGNG